MCVFIVGTMLVGRMSDRLGRSTVLWIGTAASMFSYAVNLQVSILHVCMYGRRMVMCSNKIVRTYLYYMGVCSVLYLYSIVRIYACMYSIYVCYYIICM